MEQTSISTSILGVQLSLFPLDPWGAESAFAVLNRPYPGIARAMIGPLCLGDGFDPADESLKCLAVTEDGTFAACTRVAPGQLKSPVPWWKQLTRELDAARQSPIRVSKQWTSDIPQDCVERWSDLAFWIPRPCQWDPVHRSIRAMSTLLESQQRNVESCLATQCAVDAGRPRLEFDVRGILQRQIQSAVLDVCLALNPRLRDAVIGRPRMSVSMACRLVSLAGKTGHDAQSYALQALNTESLGLLHLAASGYPENESLQVRNTIFSGGSLPGTLDKFGVIKTVHKQSLRAAIRYAEQATEQEADVSDHLISGSDWLNAMRLARNLSLPKSEDWKEFFLLAPMVLDLGLGRAETVSNILRWCLLPGFPKSCHRFRLLVSQARAFAEAANGLAGTNMMFDDAISLALALVQKASGPSLSERALTKILDPQYLGQLVIAASQLSGKSTTQLMREIFEAHPIIPGIFPVPEPFTIFPIDNVDLAVAHGADCNICLQSPATTIEYVAGGVALYGVNSEGVAVGTIALILGDQQECPHVQVLQVTGVNNSEPSPDLIVLAWSLAGAWGTASQLTCWGAYTEQCARWLRLTGVGALFRS